MKNSRISVAMCTYCGAHFLRAQLESISQQTLTPLEIVIVDDASNDETVEIIRSFSSSVQIPIRVIENEKNLGVIKNFEKAIGLCRGDIIFFADQDDIWAPEKIAAHMEIYISHPQCGYVFSDATLTDENLEYMGRNLWDAIRFIHKRQEAYRVDEQLPVMLQGGNFVYGTTMSFRATYRELLLPLATEISACTHDVWISHLLSAIGAYGVALPRTLVKYRQHSANQAGAGRNISFHDRNQSIRRARSQESKALVGVYKNMADRIRSCPNEQATMALQYLEEKIMHLSVRGNLSGEKGLSCYKAIFTEALSGRYRKYSGSWQSFIRDLVFIGK